MAELKAIYCHIPFCHSICPFCAFAVHGNKSSLHEPFLEALLADITIQAQIHGGGSSLLESLYVGGGTPSTLSVNAISRILDAINHFFPFSNACEIAFECNPEDVSPEYLRQLVKTGITRFSLGIQSFDSSTLFTLGRGHSAEDSKRAAAALRDSKIENFNIDIMFGVPGDSPKRLEKDLSTVIEFNPTHLSLYGLDIEPGTLFYRDLALRKIHESARDSLFDLYNNAVDFLSHHGLIRYETSNFSMKGREGRQNIFVWRGENYLGVGPGAHSFIDGIRFHNHRHLRGYQKEIKLGKTPVAFVERPSNIQRANEDLMVGLRLVNGLDLKAWEAAWNLQLSDEQQLIITQLLKQSLAEKLGNRLRLTLRGSLLADEISSRLFI